MLPLQISSFSCIHKEKIKTRGKLAAQIGHEQGAKFHLTRTKEKQRERLSEENHFNVYPPLRMAFSKNLTSMPSSLVPKGGFVITVSTNFLP